MIAFQFAELRRWQDFKKPGCMSEQYFLGFESVLGNTTGNPSYPGGQACGYTRLAGKHSLQSLHHSMGHAYVTRVKD